MHCTSQSLQRGMLWWLVVFNHCSAPGGFSALSYCCLSAFLCSGGLVGWARTLCTIAVFADAYAQAEQAGSGSDRVSIVLLTVIPGVPIPSQQPVGETYDCLDDSPSLQSISLHPRELPFGEFMDNISCPSQLHSHGDRIHEGLAKPPTRLHPALP
ncbi:hypothetical protein B0I75DRAFT_162740 [Yarrowia lipolytica]|nr:hypothetical protein B0I74DRAFT_167174 [Yarrowia lipolytica]RDW54463.1 hypothetical protein B0I75DRAFT_162740 [Yarrowia lipolytica]